MMLAILMLKKSMSFAMILVFIESLTGVISCNDFIDGTRNA